MLCSTRMSCGKLVRSGSPAETLPSPGCVGRDERPPEVQRPDVPEDLRDLDLLVLAANSWRRDARPRACVRAAGKATSRPSARTHRHDHPAAEQPPLFAVPRSAVREEQPDERHSALSKLATNRRMTACGGAWGHRACRARPRHSSRTVCGAVALSRPPRPRRRVWSSRRGRAPWRQFVGRKHCLLRADLRGRSCRSCALSLAISAARS